MDKIEIARRQLGTATQLFIDNLDPVSVHTLASAAREVLERECRSRNTSTILDDVSREASRSSAEIRRLADQYAKAFRHSRPEDLEQDLYLAVAFSDQANDFVLFFAWEDYRRLTGKIPAPAQAVYEWVRAIYPDKMLRPRDYSGISPLANITALTRHEQKARLKPLVKLCQTLNEMSQHGATEHSPLVFTA